MRKNVKMVLVVIGIIIGIIIIFSVLTFIISVHPPKLDEKRTPADLGLDYEEVSFKTSDGLTLRGWFIPSNYSKATIIVGHGYPFSKSNILGLGKFLNKHYNLLLFDFRYFGESQGRYTTAGWKEQKDVLAAINYLKSRKDINKSKIGAIGFSLSASTFIMTKTSDIKAIVADSPYASLDNMIERSYFIFPGPLKLPFVWITKLLAKITFGLNTKDISPEKDIKDIGIPVLLIHGDRDSQIPVENSKVLYEASDKNLTELWLVEGADHGYSYASNPDKYEKRVLEFFDEHLGV